MIANQIEFPMPVAVCAWCKPKERGQGFGLLTHGICLRHLRQMKLEAQGLIAKRTIRAAQVAAREARSLLPLL